VGVAARPAWRARSWDRFLVPKPFARVLVVYGEAIRIAEAADGTLEDATARTVGALEDVEREAWSCLDGAAPAAGVRRVPA